MARFPLLLLLCVADLGLGCGSPQTEPEMANPDDPSYAASFDGQRDPRVSTSIGEEGGLVVLWPRVVPPSDDPAVSAAAAAVQTRLSTYASELAEGRPVDVRPEPERVCRRGTGCAAVAIGAVLLQVRGSCAVVLSTSPPGESRAHLAPWVGEVDLLNPEPPFRDPPEEHLRVNDFIPCEGLEAALDERAEEIRGIVQAALPPAE